MKYNQTIFAVGISALAFILLAAHAASACESDFDCSYQDKCVKASAFQPGICVRTSGLSPNPDFYPNAQPAPVPQVSPSCMQQCIQNGEFNCYQKCTQ